MSYTGWAALAVLVAVVTDLVGPRVLFRRQWWAGYAIVIFFQLLTNGWLTLRGIVHYDESVILGPRLVGAPVEDLAFGFALVLLVTSRWVRGAPRSLEPPR